MLIGPEVPHAVCVTDSQLAVLFRQTQWLLDDAAHDFPAGRVGARHREELAGTLESLAVIVRASVSGQETEPAVQVGRAGRPCAEASIELPVSSLEPPLPVTRRARSRKHSGLAPASRYPPDRPPGSPVRAVTPPARVAESSPFFGFSAAGPGPQEEDPP